MSIRDDLNEQIKAAMKAGEKDRLETLRMLMSAVKNYEINNFPASPEGRATASDAEVASVLRKEIKTRRDSVETFRAGNREDIAAKVEKEIAIIEGFMPPAVTDAEIAAAVDAAIQETGATGMKEMGKVMKTAMAKLGGRAEGGAVNRIVKERLAPKA